MHGDVIEGLHLQVCAPLRLYANALTLCVGVFLALHMKANTVVPSSDPFFSSWIHPILSKLLLDSI